MVDKPHVSRLLLSRHGANVCQFAPRATIFRVKGERPTGNGACERVFGRFPVRSGSKPGPFQILAVVDVLAVAPDL
jgi:hypothetical protein